MHPKFWRFYRERNRSKAKFILASIMCLAERQLVAEYALRYR